MKSGETGAIAVLAEKPSVARDIARVLGADQRGQGYLHGNGYVVTWAIGHLVSLAQPHEIRSEWRQWKFQYLPMLPEQWPLVVYDKTKDQFEVVRKILNSPRVERVVCATDAGREGELIFRYIYEAAGSRKPVSRLWISSMTAEAIRKGFDKLRPGSEYDRLADAANGRSRADWLVGMNLSRAYSIHYSEELSVGRVQTPTLAMLVERELALREFKPEEYIEITAAFQGREERAGESYQGTWFRPGSEADKEKEAQARLSRLPADGEEAGEIVRRARLGEAAIESVSCENQRAQPPLLYDLTELQRHANRLYGLSAQETLNLAQALYEWHKLISYPRTDSRHISADVAATVGPIAAAVGPAYAGLTAEGTGVRPLSRRFVDDGKVTDHHAILPNAVNPGRVQLSDGERKIYDLICRRFLMMWHEDQLQAVTTVITAIRAEGVTDRWRTAGTQVLRMGWKVLDPAPEKRGKGAKNEGEENEQEQVLPALLAEGQRQDVADVQSKKKKTRPPKRFTEGTLLTAMQTAGQTLDEKELSEAMKDTGLGTPATRASIIEVLLKRGYMVRAGKTLEATEKGVHLIEVVHPEVKSPAMTGQWEAFLKKIQSGEERLAPFIDGIGAYVRSVVGKVRETPLPVRLFPAAAAPAPAAAAAAAPTEKRASGKPGAKKAGGGGELEKKPGERKKKPDEMEKKLLEGFGFSSFLPRQKAACQAVTAGKDALLVLAEGKGKSLCWQLAGLVLGGTVLVVSPRSAWMEEQVGKLKERGLAAGCLHAGLDREGSRAVCVEYLHGRLRFFFLAPERLGVAGVPAMLAKRRPALVAVEEAHCISPLSKGFRSDYKGLNLLVPELRPAPVLALSAAAAPAVRKDVVTLLGMTGIAL